MRLWAKHIILLLVFLMVSSMDMVGQGKAPPEPGNKQPVPPPPGLPIDFGVSALIAAGVGLGIYHLRRKK